VLPTNSCGVSVKLTLRDTPTPRSFIVVNVHLKAGLHTQAQTRVSEIKSRLDYLRINHPNTSVIMCGDFNDNLTPDSIVRKTLLDDGWGVPVPTEDWVTCYIKGAKNEYEPFDFIVHKNVGYTGVTNLCENDVKHVSFHPPINRKIPIPNENHPSDHHPVEFIILL